MSLKQEIIPYTDGNGLVAPYIVPPGIMRACDNGPMFTSEYYILLSQNNALTDQDIREYQALIATCIGSDGELHRAPGDSTPDEVDDHYGVLSGHVSLGLKPQFKLPFRLWRQPQLLGAYLFAQESVLRRFFIPFIALIIATSCIGVDASDSDSRRLVWHLLNTTRSSLLCRLAASFWHWRQTKVYQTNHVMLAVAAIYYQEGHPFREYWID